jgi:calcium-activated chloride channel regulator 4
MKHISLLFKWVFVLILVTTWCLPIENANAAVPEQASSPVLLDVTISLYSNPIKPEEREPYERIIEYFADGVFEASNGANKIRKVSIYTRGRKADKADVVWVQSCWPSGSISGRGTPGLRINFCDQFNANNFLSSDNAAIGGGYTMAHEWGHYFYSMYDEYLGDPSYDATFHFPHSDDLPVSQSIMNSQWNAVNGDYEWLNFSTDNNDTGKTAQSRVYGDSAWTTLVRPVSEDPRDGQRTSLPVRLYHAELVDVAPAEGEDPIVDLPDNDARSDLQIIWVSDNIAYQIVIDHSGSMADEGKMGSAIMAAQLLVDLAEPEVTTIGVIQFDDTVSEVVPLTLIVDQSTKESIKAAIGGITPNNRTAIGDAAAAALPSLEALDPQIISNRAVFLLTDGLNNEGIDPLSVIPDYQAAKIPLYTFAYGSDADPYLLDQMASQTNGRSYFSPTAMSELTQVFQDANQNISPSVGVSAGTSSLSQGSVSQKTFTVDSTLERLDIVVTFPSTPEAASFTLSAPDGTGYSPTSCNPSINETLCIFSIQSPQAGEWILNSASNSGSFDINYRITGSAQNGSSYSASISSISGDFVQYPEPIVLLAILSKELPIQGAQVTAQVQVPDGTIINFEMRDDGIAPDAVANDGLYSAIIDYAMDGTYNISVQFTNTGNASMTDLSFAPAIDSNGQSRGAPTVIPVSDNFTRFARTQVTVSNFQVDDYGNTTAEAAYLQNNNSDLSGKMDYADDVDAFMITASKDGEITLRISDLALGINPQVKVLGTDGTSVLAEANLDKNVSQKGYVFLNVTVKAGDTIYALVSNTGSVGGTYRISAGTTLPGEKPKADNSFPWWIVLIGAGILFVIVAIIALGRKPKPMPAPAGYPPAYYPPQPGYPPVQQPYNQPVPPPQSPYYPNQTPMGFPPQQPSYPPQAQPPAPAPYYPPQPPAALPIQGMPQTGLEQTTFAPPGQLIGVGTAANLVFALTDGMSIGRNPACQIRLTDLTVSRQHAQIRLMQNRWYIQDLGSSHGSYINGVRITYSALNPGDRVRIGSTEFMFQ